MNRVRVTRPVVVMCLALLSLAVTAPSARAHGEDESLEAYVLIQQALAHLAHDETHVGMDLAMEKVEDALAAEDQDGVAVAAVERAMVALEVGQIAPARRLLQGSIEEALRELPPAVGDQTGTTVIVPALTRHGPDTAREWLFLVLSALTLLGGAGLAYRFRPADTVGELRGRFSVSAPLAQARSDLPGGRP